MDHAPNVTALARNAEGADRSDLRARVEAEMSAFGLSRARAAAEIGRGVSQATLTRWLQGDYPGDVAAVEERLERWLQTRAERAAHAFGGARLDAHAETTAAGQIAAALAYAQAAGDLALIHGPSGRGKTWAAKRHCDARASAIWLRASPTITSLPKLLSRLGEAAGAGAHHGSAMEAETAIITRLEDRGALVVIDEAHHLRAALLDELRCIRDMAGCGLALIGDNDIVMTLGRCPQVKGRIGMTVDLKTVARDDIAAIAAGPLGRQPTAREMKHMARATTCDGGLHALRRLMARAWMIARAEERDAITGDDIEAAAGDAA
ncbi:AAA family ATPase [Ruegeria sp.]|uniref:AAA family ATPase n=1 Tax=Ruegeria sp. TaxID=1879320 RepID=UPI003B5B193F